MVVADRPPLITFGASTGQVAVAVSSSVLLNVGSFAVAVTIVMAPNPAGP